MAYHGYVPFISKYARDISKTFNKKPKILEIGVDTGISLFALHNNLSLLDVQFEYTGVDIKIQEHIKQMNYMFFRIGETKIDLKEINSLRYLEDMSDSGNVKFDIIMIDGDHNYHTVSKECHFISNLIHKDTLLVFDDYTGKYESEDLFYADLENYKGNNLATKKVLTKKTGVKTAIDEFLSKNKNLMGFKLIQGEPLVVIDKENTIWKKENPQGIDLV